MHPVVKLHRVAGLLLAILDVEAQLHVGDGCDPGGEIMSDQKEKKLPQSGPEDCHCHIPVSASAVTEGDDTPADSVVHWSERGSRDEFRRLRTRYVMADQQLISGREVTSEHIPGAVK